MAVGFSNVRPRQRIIIISAAAAAVLLIAGVATYSLWPRHKAGPGPSPPPKPSPSPPPTPSNHTPTAKLNSGHLIPLVGLGTSGGKGQETTDAITLALATGYRHIDTASMYGNEDAIGVALNKALTESSVRREDLFITTKLGPEAHAQADVEPALRASLKRLQLDYVDLYLVHWPVTNHPGPKLDPPMQATWAGMEGVADKGLARSIGVSNQSPEKMEAWYKDARIPPAVNQVEMHPNWRNDRVLEYAKEKGFHVTAYAPLSSPGTTAPQHLPNLQTDATVFGIANATNKTTQQVLLQWGLQHGDTEHVSVIPKSTNPEHIQANWGAVGGELSSTDFKTISSFKYQQRYFTGEGMGYSKKGPWYTYKDLWDEKPPKKQKKPTK